MATLQADTISNPSQVNSTMGRQYSARAKKKQAKYSKNQRAELHDAMREIGEGVTRYGGQVMAADLLCRTGVVSKQAAQCLKSTALEFMAERLVSFSHSYGKLRDLDNATEALEKRMGYKSDHHCRSEWHPAIEASHKAWEDEANRITAEVMRQYGEPAMAEIVTGTGEITLSDMFGIDAALDALSAGAPVKEIDEDVPPMEELKKLFPANMKDQVNVFIDREIRCSIDFMWARLNQKPLSKNQRQVIWSEMSDYIHRFWWQRRNEPLWATLNSAAEEARREAYKALIERKR